MDYTKNQDDKIKHVFFKVWEYKIIISLVMIGILFIIMIVFVVFFGYSGPDKSDDDNSDTKDLGSAISDINSKIL